MFTTTFDPENNSIPDNDSEYNYYPGIYTIVKSVYDDGKNKQTQC